MGRSTRSVPRERMSQAKLDAMITRPAETRQVLSGTIEYDTLHPQDVFDKFCKDVREMLSRYEYNSERLKELDDQMQDLLHFVELSGNKDIQGGFRLYKQIAAVRRERRSCKNELDLLQPVYNMFNNTGFMNRLQEVLGSCRSVKQLIDGRGYTIRTDVLKEI